MSFGGSYLSHLSALCRLFPRLCEAIRPFLPPLSVLDTAFCVGAPLAININSVLSPFGLTVSLLVVAFHTSAFIAGYFLSGFIFHKAPDVKALQRTLSYETGENSFFYFLFIVILQFCSYASFCRNAKQSSCTSTC